MAHISRRTLAIGAATSLVTSAISPSAFAESTADSWDAGELVHVIPTASHAEIALKLSLRNAYAQDVSLAVDGRRVRGERTDSAGNYWRFRVSDLQPGRQYRFQVFFRNRALCASWPIKTFPAPNAEITHVRIGSYTCAGGLEGARSIGGVEAFRPLAVRQKLIDRMLSFEPNAIIANGDHIYWDQHAWLEHPIEEIRRLTREAYDRFGYFDRNQLIFGTANEGLIKRLAEPQIAQLYGTRLRSTPSFFVSDDHDYFENDDATREYVTFPPEDFNIQAARAVQRLFYPEFLPDAARPARISGASAPDNAPGISECFGTLRYGRLLEANLYDCGRYLSLSGAAAGLIPSDAEAWLLARTRAEDTRHYLHVPSHPFGWSAGKWREWYPDVVAAEGAGAAVVTTHGSGVGRLTIDREKYFWQPGWFAQHQRLLAALSGQKSRSAVCVSGDLHAVGRGAISVSGDLDFSRNPVRSILSGPISASRAGWPSFARGTRPETPSRLSLSQDYSPQEKNGFVLIDAEPDRMLVRLFAWREPDSVEAIDTLQPFDSFEIKRPQ